MLLDRNQLPPPEAITRPDFDALVSQLRDQLLSRLRQDSPALADQLAEGLAQPGELISKLLDTFAQYLLNEIERRNEQARQLLPAFASGDNLDHLVAHQGLERQLLDPGDPHAIPPRPARRETDQALLLRYLLQPHAPAAGSRMAYRAAVLTLDERARISVSKPAPDQVQLTWQLDSTGTAARIRDGNGLRSGPGKVQITVLAQAGDGSAPADLISAVAQHFARDDVAPCTDQISVQSADIIRYRQRAIATLAPGPDAQISQQQLEQELQRYANEQHRLGGEIRPDYISHLLYQQGARRADVSEPASAIHCQPHQAPWCEGIDVEVRQP